MWPGGGKAAKVDVCPQEVDLMQQRVGGRGPQAPHESEEDPKNDALLLPGVRPSKAVLERGPLSLGID